MKLGPQDLRERRAAAVAKVNKIIDSIPPSKWDDSTHQAYADALADLGVIEAELRGYDAQHARILAGLMGKGTVGGDPAIWRDVNGRPLQVFGKGQKLAAHASKPQSGEEFSLSSYIRGAMGMLKNVASGPALVPEYLGSEIIDAVRAASVVVEAGAGTLQIDGPTSLAKITGDPTVYQHSEGQEDISESEMTLEPVSLNPRALVALVPLTAEVVSDSPNLDAALLLSLGGAFAGKLDALCLATILADAAVPTSATGQDPATWAGVLAATGAALGLNQKLPASFVGSQADFIARASQLASTAGWLGQPPVLAGMAELPTTSVSAGTAILGDFAQGLVVAVRQGLRLEVVRMSKPKSYSHLLVAHARMDGYILQPGRLFIQKKTVA